MYGTNAIKNPDLSHYFAKYTALPDLAHSRFVKYFSFAYNLYVPLGIAIYFTQ